MAEGHPQRPGFNLDVSFRAHLSNVRFVRYNARQGFFISCDDKSLKSWRLNTELAGPGTSGSAHSAVVVSQDVQFPSYQSSFVTCLTISQEPLNLVFVACLDGNLRLYSADAQLRLRSVMPWSNGSVRAMAFNPANSQLLTAGSYGVKAWECELDHEAYRSDKHVDPFAIPRSDNGDIIPWGFGRYQHARQRTHFHVPGAREMSSNPVHKPAAAADAGSPANVGSAEWCEHIQLHEPTQTLFAMFKGSVYGFDAGSGAPRMAFTDLHTLPITSMVYAPDTHTLITATLEDGVTVWRIAGGQPHRFRSFGKAISYVVPDDASQPTSLLACSVDGSVALWPLDAQQPLYRMKLPGGLGGPPAFYARNRIMLHLHNEVRLFSVHPMSEVWVECNSPPTLLRRLPGSGGLILAEYADSSVRLLNAAATHGDRSVVVVPPQLSARGLQAADVSLARARLYALLASGELHVWQLARGPPPRWRAAWPHLTREACTALTLLEAGCLAALPVHPSTQGRKAPQGGAPGSDGASREGAASPSPQQQQQVHSLVTALHLGWDPATGAVHEHLVLGSSSGDVLVVDADEGGQLTCRFPAFRQQAVQRVALRVRDGCRPLLLAVARCTLKVWSLDEQPRCLHILDTSQQIRQLELLGSHAVLGTSSGSVHLVDVESGQASAPTSSLDHLDAVTGCGAAPGGTHFATCARDGQIKVFTAGKVLAASVYLGSAPSAVCYLNSHGDLLVAVQRKLLVVRANKYETLAEAELGLKKGTLYSSSSASGRAVSPISRDIHPALCPPAAAAAAARQASGAASPQQQQQQVGVGAGGRRGSLKTQPSGSSATTGGGPGAANAGSLQATPGTTATAVGNAGSSTPQHSAGPGVPPLQLPVVGASRPGSNGSAKGGEQRQARSQPSSGDAPCAPGKVDKQASTSRKSRDSTGSRSSDHASAPTARTATPPAGGDAVDAGDQAADGEGASAVALSLLPPLPRTVTRTHRRCDTRGSSGTAAGPTRPTTSASAGSSAGAASPQQGAGPQADGHAMRAGSVRESAAGVRPSRGGARQSGDGLLPATPGSTSSAAHHYRTYHVLPHAGDGGQDSVQQRARQAGSGAGWTPESAGSGKGGAASRIGSGLHAGAQAEAGSRGGADSEGASSEEAEGGFSSAELSDGPSESESVTGSESEDASGSEEETEAQAAARVAAEAAELRAKQLAFLTQHWRHLDLPFQTLFKVDLSGEEQRQQRRRFGLAWQDTEPGPQGGAAQPTSQQNSSGGGAGGGAEGHPAGGSAGGVWLEGPAPSQPSSCSLGGATAPSFTAAAAPATPVDFWGSGPAVGGFHMPAGGYEEEAEGGEVDATGLPARFQRLLPLLADPGALLEGGLPPELQALLDSAGLGGKKARKKKKKPKKKAAAERRLLQPASRTATAASAASGGAAGSAAVSGLQDRGLVLTSVLAGSTPSRQTTEAADNKKKRKKKRKKGRRRPPALAVLDPARYLASVTRDHHVLLELKQLENHSMLTHTHASSTPEGGEGSSRRLRQLARPPAVPAAPATPAAGAAAAAGAAVATEAADAAHNPSRAGAMAAVRDAFSFATMLKSLSSTAQGGPNASSTHPELIKSGASSMNESQALALLERLM